MTTSWLAPCALLLVAALVFVAPTARGEDPVAVDDHGEAITYRHGDVELQGWLQRPEGADSGARLPAVLVCHAWRGHGEFVRKVAQRLARDGYVAFALDMYGKGVYAKDNAEAAKLAGPFYTDAALIRGRARAGLEVLRNRPEVDPARIGAVGFCFGGTTVLELARDGAPLAAAVSFHGGLKTKAPAEAGAVKTRLLVCHGGDDPYVAPVGVPWRRRPVRAGGGRDGALEGAPCRPGRPPDPGAVRRGARVHGHRGGRRSLAGRRVQRGGGAPCVGRG